jgi:hypothetical protein
MLSETILHFLITIHIIVWVYPIFGGFISVSNAKFILYYYVPFIYILHLLPFHIILNTKLYLIDNTIISKTDNKPDNKEYLHNKEHEYTIIKIFHYIHSTFEKCFANPLSPQGLLILSLIINLYIVKYYWNEKL